MCSYDRLHVFHSGKSFFLIPLYFFYFFLPQGRVDDPRTEEENDSSDDELEQLLYFSVGPGHVELSEDEGHSDRAAGDGGEADAEEDDEDGSRSCSRRATRSSTRSRLAWASWTPRASTSRLALAWRRSARAKQGKGGPRMLKW